MDNKPWSYRSRHLQHDGVNDNQEEPEGDDRQGEGQNFEDQSQRGVYKSENDSTDQRGHETLQLNAGDNVSDNHQRQSIDKPTQQEPHRFRPLRQGCLAPLLQRTTSQTQLSASLRGLPYCRPPVR